MLIPHETTHQLCIRDEKILLLTRKIAEAHKVCNFFSFKWSTKFPPFFLTWSLRAAKRRSCLLSFSALKMRPGVTLTNSKFKLQKRLIISYTVFKLIINSPHPSYSLQYSLCSYMTGLSSFLSSYNSHTDTDHAQDLGTITTTNRTVTILCANKPPRANPLGRGGEERNYMKKLLGYLLQQEARRSIRTSD